MSENGDGECGRESGGEGYALRVRVSLSVSLKLVTYTFFDAKRRRKVGVLREDFGTLGVMS